MAVESPGRSEEQQPSGSAAVEERDPRLRYAEDDESPANGSALPAQGGDDPSRGDTSRGDAEDGESVEGGEPARDGKGGEPVEGADPARGGGGDQSAVGTDAAEADAGPETSDVEGGEESADEPAGADGEGVAEAAEDDAGSEDEALADEPAGSASDAEDAEGGAEAAEAAEEEPAAVAEDAEDADDDAAAPGAEAPEDPRRALASVTSVFRSVAESAKKEDHEHLRAAVAAWVTGSDTDSTAEKKDKGKTGSGAEETPAPAAEKPLDPPTTAIRTTPTPKAEQAPDTGDEVQAAEDAAASEPAAPSDEDAAADDAAAAATEDAAGDEAADTGSDVAAEDAAADTADRSADDVQDAATGAAGNDRVAGVSDVPAEDAAVADRAVDDVRDADGAADADEAIGNDRVAGVSDAAAEDAAVADRAVDDVRDAVDATDAADADDADDAVDAIDADGALDADGAAAADDDDADAGDAEGDGGVRGAGGVGVAGPAGSTFVPLRVDADLPAKPAAPPRPAVPPKPAEAPEVLPGYERTKQQPLPAEEEEKEKRPLDLLAELTNTPPPAETLARTIARRIKIWSPLVILLVIVLGVVQLLRPLPAPSLELTAAPSYSFKGAEPEMPWPSEGQAAVDVLGLGSLGSYGKEKPVPIASVAKVMTAYVFLREHPVEPGTDGTTVPVDAKAVEEAGLSAEGETTVELDEGAKLTQKEVLKALMIASANNVARLVARWDSDGDPQEFVDKMNEAAEELGMENTRYTDPSGLTETTVSTAVDQVKLAKAAMKDPLFKKTVGMSAYKDSRGDEHGNSNTLLPGLSSGVKVGSTTKAGGNYIFASEKKIAGTEQLVVGAVLGQYEVPQLPTAIDRGRQIFEAAEGVLQEKTVVKKGDVVGVVDDGLGGSTPVVATKDVTAVGWPGLKVELEIGPDKSGEVPHADEAGAEVGVLTMGGGQGEVRVPVALGDDLAEPGAGAKLTRLG